MTLIWWHLSKLLFESTTCDVIFLDMLMLVCSELAVSVCYIFFHCNADFTIVLAYWYTEQLRGNHIWSEKNSMTLPSISMIVGAWNDEKVQILGIVEFPGGTRYEWNYWNINVKCIRSPCEIQTFPSPTFTSSQDNLSSLSCRVQSLRYSKDLRVEMLNAHKSAVGN